MKWILLSAMLVGGTAALASIDAGLTGQGWQELTFEDKRANEFTLTEDGEIAISGDAAVSVLWRPLAKDLGENLSLSWRWRVDAGPPSTDLTRKGGDDRAISLYVSFEFDPERASFWERSKRALIQPFVADELPGRVLLYVWGGEPAGDEWLDNPYFDGIGKMKILHAAETAHASGFEQEIDLRADHIAAFGEEPTTPYQLAISSDGDDTRTEINATVADIRINGEPLR